MSGIVPDDGVCEACGKPVAEDDGYVVIDETGRWRYCDDCGPDE